MPSCLVAYLLIHLRTCTQAHLCCCTDAFEEASLAANLLTKCFRPACKPNLATRACIAVSSTGKQRSFSTRDTLPCDSMRISSHMVTFIGPSWSQPVLPWLMTFSGNGSTLVPGRPFLAANVVRQCWTGLPQEGTVITTVDIQSCPAAGLATPARSCHKLAYRKVQTKCNNAVQLRNLCNSCGA